MHTGEANNIKRVKRDIFIKNLGKSLIEFMYLQNIDITIEGFATK